MLAERAIQWPQEWREEGLQQGLAQGREEGREEVLQKAALALARRNVSVAEIATELEISHAVVERMLSNNDRPLELS